MSQDLFTYLPSEIIINILSRLPVRNIVSCKCVCKSWLDLVETHEFVKFHLSISVPRLLVSEYEEQSKLYTILEFVDEEYDQMKELLEKKKREIERLQRKIETVEKDYETASDEGNQDYETASDEENQEYETTDDEDLTDYGTAEKELNLEHHKLHYNPVTKFNLPYNGRIHGSANGLLFLRDKSLKPDGLFICNPITRDYIKLHCPQEFVCSDKQFVTYGFGVSKISGQYKVVRICQECHRQTKELVRISKHEWQVYTLGTGSWRRIAPPGPNFLYGDPSFFPRYRTTGPFLNGNLHWLVFDLNSHPCISCFDLETELFCTLNSPLPPPGSRGFDAALCALGNSLCLCDSTADDEIVIWLLKECGDEKIWIKEFVIDKTPEHLTFRYMYGLLLPRKVFKDGDIWMEWDGSFLFSCSENNKTEEFHFLESWNEAIIHTPSFFSLKSFKTENVSSF